MVIGAEVDLGGQEQVAAGDAAGLDALAHCGLVAVGFRRVDEPVTGLDGGAHGVPAGCVVHLKGAKAQQGHGLTVVQGGKFHKTPPF